MLLFVAVTVVVTCRSFYSRWNFLRLLLLLLLLGDWKESITQLYNLYFIIKYRPRDGRVAAAAMIFVKCQMPTATCHLIYTNTLTITNGPGGVQCRAAGRSVGQL